MAIRRGTFPALFSLMLLAAGTALLGSAGCGAGPSKRMAGQEEAERLALADRGTFDVSRPPPEAPPQRVASFRSAAEGRADRHHHPQAGFMPTQSARLQRPVMREQAAARGRPM